MPIQSKQIIVVNKRGLHARPVMQFVDLANQFTSKITVAKGGEDPFNADGKSVLQMIGLEATQGTPLTLSADGEDSQTAITQLAELFATGFGEED